MADGAEQVAERLAAIRRDAQSVAQQTAVSVQAADPSAKPVQAKAASTESAFVRAVSNITLGSFVLLTLTGVHLFFYYEPISRLSGDSQLAGGTSGVGGLSELSRQLHWLAAWLVACGVVVGFAAWVWPRRRALVVVAAPIAALFALAGIAGQQAAWHNATFAAGAPDYPTGFIALYRDYVETIVRDDSSVSALSLTMWVVAHIALALLAIALVAAARRAAQAS